MNRQFTRLPLVLLVVITCVALAWLLRDLSTGRLGASTSAPAAFSSPEPTAVVSAPTTMPTSLPSAAPIAAPSEQSTAAPSPTPTAEPTLSPTAAPTEAPTSTPTSAPTVEVTAVTNMPSAGEIAGYIGHKVGEGETLASIAAAGGSTAEQVKSYNRLTDEPQPGRALIVPQLAGQQSSLESMPLLVERGSKEQPWVALTLDAGAGSEPVVSILKTLRERNVHLTFFLTGKWIRDNPDLTRQMIADGHEIANHTMNHPDLRTVDDQAIRDELAQTEAELHAVAGDSATLRPFFRPPYGAYDTRVLKVVEAEGYMPIYWTLDSLDSVGKPKTPQFLLERVTSKLSPEQLRGAIILAHCGSAPTAEALPAILDRFAEMGFQVKKLSEVL